MSDDVNSNHAAPADAGRHSLGSAPEAQRGIIRRFVDWNVRWGFDALDGHRWSRQFVREISKPFQGGKIQGYIWKGWLALVAYNVLVGVLAALDALVANAGASSSSGVGSLFQFSTESLPAKWMKEILGSGLPYLNNTTPDHVSSMSTVLGQMLSVLNAGALALGGFMVLYGFVAGVAQTAHEGEPLGRRWSSLWVPIRLPIGVGLLVPISGGFSAAQLIVVWLALVGSGLADTVWQKGVNALASGSAVINSPTVDGTNFAKNLLMNLVCEKSYLLQDVAAPELATNPIKTETYTGGGRTTTRTMKMYQIDFSAAGVNGACGYAHLIEEVQTLTVTGGNSNQINPSFDLNKIKTYQNAVYAEQKRVFLELKKDLAPIADSIAKANKPNSTTAMPTDAAAFNAAVNYARAQAHRPESAG